jgi:urease beta subunit
MELGLGARSMEPGAISVQDGTVTLNRGLEIVTVTVTNASIRPVRVSSHFPFWIANPRLEFDRAAAAGCRLDIPAGSTIRWAPGETKKVRLVKQPELS